MNSAGRLADGFVRRPRDCLRRVVRDMVTRKPGCLFACRMFQALKGSSFEHVCMNISYSILSCKRDIYSGVECPSDPFSFYPASPGLDLAKGFWLRGLFCIMATIDRSKRSCLQILICGFLSTQDLAALSRVGVAFLGLLF